MTVEQLSQIIDALDGIRKRLVAEGAVPEDGVYPSHNVAEGLVMIAEAIDRNTAAIDRNTAAITALAPELRNQQ